MWIPLEILSGAGVIKLLRTTKDVGQYHGGSLAWPKDVAQLDCALAPFRTITMGPHCDIELNIIFVPSHKCPTRKRKQTGSQFRTRFVKVI